MADDPAKLQAELDKLEQAIATQEGLRGIMPDEQIDETIRNIEAKKADCERRLQQALSSRQTAPQSGGDRAVSNSRAGANIVSGDNNIIAKIIKIYTEAGKEEDTTPDPKQLQAQISDYLNWLVDRTAKIELRGIKREGQQVVQLDLETVYVPLAAKSYGYSARNINLDQVLQMGRRLVITGGPGCGKTTVLLHLAWVISQAIQQNNPDLVKDKLGLAEDEAIPLPIFIPLSAYAQRLRHLEPNSAPEDKTLASFISHYLIEKQSSFKLPTDFFQQLLQQGKSVVLLLDGLDEVPTEAERAVVREAIEDLVTGRDEMRVVVTCRTAAYNNRSALGREFSDIQVQPLADKHLEALVRQAYQALYREDRQAQKEKATELLESIAQLEAERRQRFGEDTLPLVTSPLMVRMLLIVHCSEHHLPEQRAELYLKAVDAMLLPEYGPDAAVAERIGGLVGGSREVHRELAQHLAFKMHERGGTQGRDISEEDLRQILNEHPSYVSLSTDFIALTRQRGTLMEERLGNYRFIHLAFQEFLTARYLAEIIRGEGGVAAIAAYLEAGPILDSWWREVALLIIGYLSFTSPQTARLLLRRLVALDDKATERQQHLAAETQVIAAEIAGTALLEWPGDQTDLKAEISKGITQIFANADYFNQAKPIDRVRLGRVLGKLGDPRPGVGLGEDNLPDIVWCDIPAGLFVMGSDQAKDRLADKREMPQRRVETGTFRISKYLITNAQYEPFVADGGYTDRWQRCWTEEGWAWKRERNAPSKAGGEFDLPNHPAVNTSWYEAEAFCRWLTESLRAAGKLSENEEISLPSEVVWEKAARGTEGLIYPWGNDPDSNRANYNEAGIDTTSAVGCFPGGGSVYGCQDMVGNVWEWGRTKWERDYKNYRNDNDLAGTDARVVRGGAFSSDDHFVRCAGRYWDDPFVRYGYQGFRVIVSPIS